MRTLITGVAGFAGSHLAEYLLGESGVDVAGIVRPGSDLRHIAHLLPRLRLFAGDVTDGAFLNSVLADWRPDQVFHLAAQSATSRAASQARETLTTNIIGQLTLLEAAARTVRHARVLVVGSAEEYGLVHPDELPIRETNPLRPTNSYGVSKIAQDMLGYQFYLTEHLPTIRVRPFNHIGPRQSEAFVMPALASQVAEIEAGRREPVLVVGNLESRRDFCDVRDIVRAYWLALLRGQPGEVYNLGSGQSHSIAEMLNMLLRHARIAVTIEQDQARMRPSDIPDLVCDCSKFCAQTGWQPTITLDQSVFDLLDYYRSRGQEEVGK